MSKMKRVFILFALLAVLSCVVNAQDYQIKFSKENYGEYQVSFSLKDWNLELFKTDDADYQKIMFSSSAVTVEKGWAELPFVNASIQLPANKNVDLSVDYADYQDFILDYPLLPSRGTITRSQDPEKIAYAIDPASIVDKFYPVSPANSIEPFIIRDVRGTTVTFYPFQWNAVSKTLRVYKNMTVVLTENNQPATNPLLKENANPIREARGMYKSIFLNYSEPRVPLALAGYGEILVITTARDATTIDPYIKWKREKGYIVHKEIVATNTNVKTLIQQKYNENNNILYVQLVGDWADIKSDTESFGSLGTGPKDPMLGCVVGTDNFPEIAIGRFSCSNAEQLTIQINKALQYEKTPNMEAGWYSSFIGVGSNDTGPADDNEKDWLHVQRIYNQRLETTYNYNTHYRLYENESGCTSTNLGNYINNGASTIAYCGHGGTTNFVTTGFSNSNVNQLTNGTKLPFIVAVACLNGAFHNSSDCFAEAWLKKANGGAVVTWMSTVNQPWAPPMRGQDYFYDILIGGFNYNNYSGQNGINTEELRTNWGSITVNSVNLMLSESNGSEDITTVKTWTTFGDVNLQLRTKLPAVISSSNNILLQTQPFETIITTNGNPVANALVCISQNDNYFSGITNANGEVSIPNECEPGEVLLVITAFNSTTIYENIDCLPLSGPFVVQDGYEVLCGDKLTYMSENCNVAINLKNVGTQDTNGTLSVSIFSEDPQLIINNAISQCNIINAGETSSAIFNISIANNITDKKTFPIIVTVTDSDETIWTSNLILTAYAPKFIVEKIKINDIENGNISAGSLINIALTIKNEGNADAYQINGEIETISPYILLACGDLMSNLSQNIFVNESIDFYYTMIASPDMPFGHQANINLLLLGQNGISSTVPFTVGSAGNSAYCTPGLTTCSDYNDRITSLLLVKTSDQSVLINNPAPLCTSNGYTDYSDEMITMIPGQQYTIKVKTGYQSHRVRGWIDVNGNNTFDNNESLFTISCANANTEYTATFTVPATSDPGTHRFRIRTRDASTVPDACGEYSWGQTIDYSVVISEMYPRVQNVYAELDGSDITITWEEPENETNLEGYNVYRNGIKLNTELLSDKTFTEEDIIEGIYAYSVTAYYQGNKESFSEMSNVICNFVTCEKPANVSVLSEQYENVAFITWEEPENYETELLGYNIFRNSIKLNDELIEETEYIDNVIPNGTYNYQISAVYDNCESSLTKAITVLVFIPQYCETPVNISASALQYSNTAVITWNEPENIDQILSGYNIYRNEVKINEELLLDTEYQDEDLPNGSYIYQVSVEYDFCGESVLTQEVSVEIFVPQYCNTPVNVSGVSEKYSTTAVITWDEPENIDQQLLGYNIYREGSKINNTLRSEREYIDSELDNGIYTYQVTAIYDYCGESDLINATPTFVTIHVPQYCDEPENLFLTYATCVCPSIFLFWNAPEIIDQILLGYNIYRNNIKINTELVTETEYSNERMPYESYIYQVSAVYDYCGESVLTEGKEAEVFVGINSNQSESYKLFPNPATDNLTITGAGLNRVEIFDIQGRKVAEYINLKEMLQINDLKKFENGIYLVKMFSNTNYILINMLMIIK